MVVVEIKRSVMEGSVANNNNNNTEPEEQKPDATLELQRAESDGTYAELQTSDIR